MNTCQATMLFGLLIGLMISGIAFLMYRSVAMRFRIRFRKKDD